MRIDMAIEYLGLSEINGPLVAVEGVRGAFYDEIVELVVEGKQKKLGRIVEINNDYAVVQVFESTEEMSLFNTHARLTGRPLCVGLSEEILGRTFNGLGQPIDGLGAVHAEVVRDVNGQPMNPCSREYPRNYIRTGISAIDGLTTLIRGQKLPPRLWNRPVLGMAKTRTNRLQSCLPRWESNMMWRSILSAVLQNVV